MRIFPNAVLKDSADCEPGELIRIRGFQHDAIGLIACHDEKRYLVLLDGDEPGGTPCFTTIGSGQSAISYGHDYEVVVDHSAEIELRKKDLYEVPGCLVRTSDSWMVRVRPAIGMGPYHAAYYDLESSGLSMSIDRSDAVTFTRWEVRLPAEAATDRPTTLFRSNPKLPDAEE